MPGSIYTLIVCLVLSVTRVAVAMFPGEMYMSKLGKDQRYNFNKAHTDHPMLFFGRDDVDRLRVAAGTTHKHITDQLEIAADDILKTHMPPTDQAKFASFWNEIYGNNLPPLALYYMLRPNQSLLDLIIEYMDRMASYRSWYVANSPHDEVPVSHHLVGFATALDIIYNDLDKPRQAKYVKKVVDVTQHLYMESKYKWWGKSYLQNHVATNVIAIFIGSLVSSVHINNTVSKQWKQSSVSMMESSMELLDLIEDGSLDEGVGYVGYTMRSVTQYIYLLKRHIGVDRTKDPWLLKHFDFYYYNILPGFKDTIGIADSSRDWFYGPESQLVFLDALVLRNGNAYWLAQNIRKYRRPLKTHSFSQRYVTLHTEFVFYDPSIKATAPPNHDSAELFHFSDLGLVTYRSGNISDKEQTFFSFKSGKIHGAAVYDLAHGYSSMSGEDAWRFFNPGHEHPDHNSITFWCRGIPFMTENYYSPKLTSLDNVLMFYPSDSSPCSGKWAGQLGDCDKFLRWRGDEDERNNRGEILSYEKKGDIVTAVGESTHSYTRSLGLASVIRSTVLIGKDILIICDTVVLKSNSTTTHTAVMFNNYDLEFETHMFDNIHGTKIKTEDGRHLSGFWITDNGASSSANITKIEYKTVGGVLTRMSNLNITIPLSDTVTSICYIFYGPDAGLKSSVISRTKSSFVINLTLRSKNYTVELPFYVRSRRGETGNILVNTNIKSSGAFTDSSKAEIKAFTTGSVRSVTTNSRQSWQVDITDNLNTHDIKRDSETDQRINKNYKNVDDEIELVYIPPRAVTIQNEKPSSIGGASNTSLLFIVCVICLVLFAFTSRKCRRMMGIFV